MTKLKSYKTVGHVSDAFGLKGELYIHLKARKADWLKNFTEFSIQSVSSGDILNFKISNKRPHKNGIVVKPVGVDDRTAAEKLIGWEFAIPAELLKSQAGENFFLDELKGFVVIDSKLGELGPVLNFSTNGVQDLLVLQIEKREVLIPLVDAFIDKIDKDNRRIEMSLPEGLIDVENKKL